MKERLENAKKEMSAKLKDSAETLQIAGMLAQDEIEKKSSEIKGELVAAHEQLKEFSERNEAKRNSKLIELQMNLEAAADALEEKRKEKEKLAHDEYVNSLIDYAEYCQKLADVLTKEAQAALIEAEKESAE